jgi:hypothetical protein
MKIKIIPLGMALLLAVVHGQTTPRSSTETKVTADQVPGVDENIKLTAENIPLLEKQKELRRQRNYERRQKEAWRIAYGETERIYGNVLEVLSLDNETLGKLKILLTNRALAATDVREVTRTLPPDPKAVPDAITAAHEEIDAEIARLVGDAKASIISEIIALGSRVAFIQSRFADGIAKEAEPLSSTQVLALARAMAAVQEPLLTNPDRNALYRASLVREDGLSEVDREILSRAAKSLTEAQFAAYRRLIMAKSELLKEQQKKAPFLQPLLKP